MAWAAANARVQLEGYAIIITKQACCPAKTLCNDVRVRSVPGPKCNAISRELPRTRRGSRSRWVTSARFGSYERGKCVAELGKTIYSLGCSVENSIMTWSTA